MHDLRSSSPGIVVVARDGTVLAVAGDTPPDWVGQHVPAALGSDVQVLTVEAVPLHRAPADLAQLLSGALEVMRGQATHQGVDLHLEVAGDLPLRAKVDGRLLAWVVTTLVGNALRFVRTGSRLKPGGTITVRLDFDAARSEVVITVQDDGPGIPADRLPHLFRRDAKVMHLTGLALLLVHEVAAAHGGAVTVASRTDAADHGTTITVRIPI